MKISIWFLIVCLIGFGLFFCWFVKPFWMEFVGFFAFLATLRKLEKTHGARARAPKSRVWGLRNGTKIKKKRIEICFKIWSGKSSQNGAKMEAKLRQNRAQKASKNRCFFGLVLEWLWKHWSFCGGGCDGATFSSGSPRAALVRAGLSNKNRQRGMAYRI